MKKIDSHAHFKQEFETLIRKIDKNIAELALLQKVNMTNPTVDLTEKLNRLKIHRAKLKNYFLSYADVCEEEWIETRGEAAEIFKKAEEEFLIPFGA